MTNVINANFIKSELIDGLYPEYCLTKTLSNLSKSKIYESDRVVFFECGKEIVFYYFEEYKEEDFGECAGGVPRWFWVRSIPKESSITEIQLTRDELIGGL